MKTIRTIGLVAILMLVGALATTAAEADRLDGDVRDTIQKFQEAHPRIQRLFNEAYGYAVFPGVGKGAIGIGGAEGRGQVYEGGVLIGTARLTQATIGAQLGAQTYSEVVFFASEKALDEFRDGKTAISAALSGAIAADGAGTEAKYQHGVLVYTMDRSGLMFEASIGGQHFKFMGIPASTPLPPATQAAPPPPPATQTTPPAPAPPTESAPPPVTQ